MDSYWLALGYFFAVILVQVYRYMDFKVLYNPNSIKKNADYLKMINTCDNVILIDRQVHIVLAELCK